MRVGLVVGHIFMQDKLLNDVIFSPGRLALDLANGLSDQGIDVTLFTPGKVTSRAINITADLSYFESELKTRGDNYIDLLKKHPLTFITMSRQVQSELIAKAYKMANDGKLDIVHIYTNEEDIAMPFAALCTKPVVMTHHDPYNFLAAYRSVFPKYPHLNWISLSMSQRSAMPAETNWLANIYHGVDEHAFAPNYDPNERYIAYMGRIIEPKGVHLAIKAVKKYNDTHKNSPLVLKIAGKHYAGRTKNTYWEQIIEPEIDGEYVQYVGFIKDATAKQEFLGNARALIMPSVFDEPFGMVMIEALACATPVVGLSSGAIPEVVINGSNGYLVEKAISSDGKVNESKTVENIVEVLSKIDALNRNTCRKDFEDRFTLDRMISEHIAAYQKLARG